MPDLILNNLYRVATTADPRIAGKLVTFLGTGKYDGQDERLAVVRPVGVEPNVDNEWIVKPWQLFSISEG